MSAGQSGKRARRSGAANRPVGAAKLWLAFGFHLMIRRCATVTVCLDAPRLFDVIKTRRQVKAVVFRHSPVYRFETWEGIHLINLPAVGYNFRNSDPVGWVEARLRADGASFLLRACGGNLAGDGKTTEVTWRS